MTREEMVQKLIESKMSMASNERDALLRDLLLMVYENLSDTELEEELQEQQL